jgi:tRNA dimethylallyltransferase
MRRRRAVACVRLGTSSRVRAAILINGPTASGKTRLAIELAKRLDGDVVNADAMQVYADLNVLTARPDAGELAEARHILFGHVDAAERHSVGRWQAEAAAAIAAIQSAGRTPIVVGGTGLYLQALIEGLAEVPPIPDDVREETRAAVAASPRAAWSRLSEADPASAARIQPQDRQRIARALEVLAATGRPLSSYHGEAKPPLAPGGWISVALTPSREATYGRIDTRVDRMMKAGALDEARALWERGIEPEAPVMRAHGMPGFADHFSGRATLAEAIDRCKRDTRRYAKRQMTWIANQFPLWPRVPSEDTNIRTRVTATFWETLMRQTAG